MEKTCPICKLNNNCQIENSVADCWCMKIILTKKALRKIEQENITNMCICVTCLKKLNVNN